MVGWQHRLDGHGFGWTPGVGDGQGGLAHCSLLGHRGSDLTERLNNSNKLQNKTKASDNAARGERASEQNCPLPVESEQASRTVCCPWRASK